MEFIERYLGFSIGPLEAMLLLVLVIIITAIVTVFFHKRYERH